MQQFTAEQTAQLLELIKNQTPNGENTEPEDNKKEDDENEKTKEELKKIQEERAREKAELEKSKSLIQTFKEALGFTKKEPPKKTNEDLINDLDNDKDKENKKTENTKDDKDDKESKEQSELTKTVKGLTEVVKNLNDEIKSLKADKEQTKLKKELTDLGLEDEDEQKLFTHLKEDVLDGKPKEYKLPEKQIINLISQAKAMARAKKERIQASNREDIYERLKNQGTNNGVNKITVRDFNKMSLKEKEQLNTYNPIIYNALKDQSFRNAGIRQI